MTVRIDGMHIIDSTVTAPSQATNPGPADQAGDVDRQTDLSWSPGARTSKHYVYFGTSDPPQFRASVSNESYSLPELEPGTTYYWRIDEMNEAGITPGETWIFTTGVESTGLEGRPENSSSFDLVPNPARGQVKLLLPAVSGTLTIRLIDLKGRTIMQKSTRENDVTLDLSDLGNGIYLVQVQDNQSISTRKLILEH
jgi:hypothetical protein